MKKALAGACLLILAGCGGTAQTTSGATSPGGDELSARQVEVGLGATANGGAGATGGVAGSTGAGGAVAGRASANAAKAGAGSAAAAQPTGPRDTTPIRLGVLYLNGGNTVISAAFGNTPVSFGDGQLEANAVIADINARGGGGRKIEPYFAEVAVKRALDPDGILNPGKLVPDAQ